MDDLQRRISGALNPPPSPGPSRSPSPYGINQDEVLSQSVHQDEEDDGVGDEPEVEYEDDGNQEDDRGWRKFYKL